MAKKKKTRVETAEGEALTHNPFAALLPTEGLAPSSGRDAAVAAEPETEPAAPFEPKLVVRTQRKGRGGKTVTRISGVREASRAGTAKRMKKALGCGAVVEDEDVILLGEVEDRAVEWLESEGARRVVRG